MNEQKIDGKLFYWLKSSRTEKNVKCRFQREEIFAIQTILIDFYIDFSTNLRKNKNKKKQPHIEKKNLGLKKHLGTKNNT